MKDQMSWRKSLFGAILWTLPVGGPLLFACAPDARIPDLATTGSTPTLQGKPTASDRPTTSRIASQEEWSRLISAARNEGKVTLYTDSPMLRGRFSDGFSDKYGVQIEIIAGRPTELAEKLQRERRAGIYLADAVLGGPQTLVKIMKPIGVLDPLEPGFMLPEVISPEEIQKVWWRGKLFWNDGDHTSLAFMATPSTMMAINTEMVKPAITSYREMLDPKWKGKIIFQDPTAGGGGFDQFATVGAVFVNWDFWRELMSKQEPVFTRDSRLQAEWVARGKHAIAFAPRTEMVTFFRGEGAPIDFVVPAEGVFVSSGVGGIGLVNKAAHQSAARLFLNFLLTREGQTLHSQSSSLQSARLDVPTDHLLPAKIRQPGKEYFVLEGDQQWETSDSWRKIVDEIVKPLLK